MVFGKAVNKAHSSDGTATFLPKSIKYYRFLLLQSDPTDLFLYLYGIVGWWSVCVLCPLGGAAMLMNVRRFSSSPNSTFAAWRGIREDRPFPDTALGWWARVDFE